MNVYPGKLPQRCNFSILKIPVLQKGFKPTAFQFLFKTLSHLDIYESRGAWLRWQLSHLVLGNEIVHLWWNLSHINGQLMSSRCGPSIEQYKGSLQPNQSKLTLSFLERKKQKN